MWHRTLRLPFWSAVLFTFVMASLPYPPELPGAPTDKVLHVLAFSVITILAVLTFPKVSRLRLAASLAAFGALIEMVQTIPALNRHGDVLDWAADALAVLTFLAIAGAIRHARSGKMVAEEGLEPPTRGL